MSCKYVYDYYETWKLKITGNRKEEERRTAIPIVGRGVARLRRSEMYWSLFRVIGAAEEGVGVETMFFLSFLGALGL